MQASESPFESYKSKEISFLAYLKIVPKFPDPKRLRFAIFNFSEKFQNIFDKDKKIRSDRTKIALKIFFTNKQIRRNVSIFYVSN